MPRGTGIRLSALAVGRFSGVLIVRACRNLIHCPRRLGESHGLRAPIHGSNISGKKY